jgi:hypothetical protein
VKGDGAEIGRCRERDDADQEHDLQEKLHAGLSLAGRESTFKAGAKTVARASSMQGGLEPGVARHQRVYARL